MPLLADERNLIEGDASRRWVAVARVAHGPTNGAEGSTCVRYRVYKLDHGRNSLKEGRIAGHRISSVGSLG